MQGRISLKTQHIFEWMVDEIEFLTLSRSSVMQVSVSMCAHMLRSRRPCVCSQTDGCAPSQFPWVTCWNLKCGQNPSQAFPQRRRAADNFIRSNPPRRVSYQIRKLSETKSTPRNILSKWVQQGLERSTKIFSRLHDSWTSLLNGFR